MLIPIVCLVSLLAATPTAAGGRASLAAFAGIQSGGGQNTTASWWAAAYAHPNPVLGIGVEAGVDGWDSRGTDRVFFPIDNGIAVESAAPFGIDLDSGPDQLRHVAGALQFRMPGLDGGSGPYARLVMGAYQQVARERQWFAPYEPVVRETVRPGGAIALGASGRRGLAPGAEFRVQWVSTTDGPLTTFTAAFGLDLDLGRRR